MDLTGWHERAACYNAWEEGVDFFPDGQAQATELIESYCVACPVRYECAVDALEQRKGFVGVWAGAWFPPHGGKQHAVRRAEAYRVVHAIVSDRSDAA